MASICSYDYDGYDNSSDSTYSTYDYQPTGSRTYYIKVDKHTDIEFLVLKPIQNTPEVCWSEPRPLLDVVRQIFRCIGKQRPWTGRNYRK